MAAIGLWEVLLLLLAGGGGLPDLAWAVDPGDYFASRQVDLTIDKMVGLAGQDPKDPKTQVMQLLALRYLEANGEKLKQAPRYAVHRQTLEAIASGNRAQDPQGFAREYARRVLARVDGKSLPAPAAPKLREDALAWFPADATFVAALDSRPVQGGPLPASAVSDLFKKLPEGEKAKFYEVLEKTGNVRVDRVAFAYVHDAAAIARSKIFLRLTGKANPAWVIPTLRDTAKMQETQVKDAAGQTVTLLEEPGRAPILMVISATEMMVVGYNGDAEKHADLVEEVTAVRAGKKASAATGALKARLQKVPDQAIALAVGDVPDEPVRGELSRLLGGTPLKVDAHVEKVPTGFDVSVVGTMQDAQAAQAAVMKLGTMRKEGIDTLQKLLKQPDAAPRVPANSLINLLESLQMQSEGPELRLRLLVPGDVLPTLPSWVLSAVR
jgi:hypothetical protein